MPRCPPQKLFKVLKRRPTSPVVYTRPGAPRISGASTLVPKQYRQLMHRNSARRSPTPATQNGKPCSTTFDQHECSVACASATLALTKGCRGCSHPKQPVAGAPEMSGAGWTPAQPRIPRHSLSDASSQLACVHPMLCKETPHDTARSTMACAADTDIRHDSGDVLIL